MITRREMMMGFAGLAFQAEGVRSRQAPLRGRVEPPALMEIWGEISPDGSLAAYTTGSQEIFLARTDGGGVRKLVDAPSAMPSWKPDGSSLLFISAREYEAHGWSSYDAQIADGRITALHSGDRNAFQLWPGMSHDGHYVALIEQYGGHLMIEQPGLPDAPEDIRGAFSYAVWSPIAPILALAAWGTGAVQPSTGLYLWDANPPGSLRRLTDRPLECAPSWSPDGAHLACAVEGHIIVVSARDGAVTPVTQSRSREGAPCWSPDGRWIAFARGGEIWTVCPDGSGPRQITRSGGLACYPRWIPRSASLVYAGSGKSGIDLYRVDADGRHLHQITATGNIGRPVTMLR